MKSLFRLLLISTACGADGRLLLKVLFIVTDQQRWDAMSCAGNSVLKTPHLVSVRTRAL